MSISGKDISLEFDNSKPSIATKVALDSTVAKETLGWGPTITLEKGIKKTMDWYKLNLNRT